MTKYYKLEGKTVVPCRDLMEWANWLEVNPCHVANEKIGGIRVSTVFLGLDHNFSMQGKPILFETMIFIGRRDVNIFRYCFYEEAEAGHKKIVENIKRHPWNLIVLPWMLYIWNEIFLPMLQIVINKVWELGSKIKSRFQ